MAILCSLQLNGKTVELVADPATNACGAGFCASCNVGQEVVSCRREMNEGCSWNGLCARQDGNMVDENNVRMGYVLVSCCQNGCQMPVGQYAAWNGLCAYQREDRNSGDW